MDNPDEDAAVIQVPVPVVGSDPNVLGETLRDLTFVGGYGCYESFDVRADAVELPHEEAEQFFWPGNGEDDNWWGDVATDQHFGYRYEHQGLTIECFWYWDGDGDLAFRVSKDGRVLRAIENTDCKKGYRWEDHEPPVGERRSFDIEAPSHIGRTGASVSGMGETESDSGSSDG